MEDLLKDLRDHNCVISLEGGDLKVKFDGDALPVDLIDKLKNSKAQLVEYLKGLDQPRVEEEIPLAASQADYELSSSQRRLWVLSQLTEGNVAYNMPGVYEFEGKLDEGALLSSFRFLIRRHESLRTVFREDESGEVRQYILPTGGDDFEIIKGDLRGSTDQEGDIRAIISSERNQGFDLFEGPLVRSGLYRLGAERWLFTYTMHHIVSDGWSMGVLIWELLNSYRSYSAGQVPSVLPLRIQYKDYSAWQQEQLRGGGFESHRSYWQEQLSGELPVLELRGDHVRPALKTYKGGSVSRRLSAELSGSLKSLTQSSGGTLFMSLLAGVNVLLYRYTGQTDQIIGSPIAGREHIDLEDQIGFYVNTLALRTRLSGAESYHELLGRVREVTLGAYEHQSYPFDELVNDLDLRRDLSRNALFDVMVVLQNNGLRHNREEERAGDLRIRSYGSQEQETSKFDLLFTFTEVGETLRLDLEYNSDIYTRRTAEQLSEHLEGLFSSITNHPDVPIQDLDYLSSAEQHQLLVSFNSTSVAYAEDKTVIDLFEEQAARTPDKTALVFEQTALTYRELNEKSNQLARYIRDTLQIDTDCCISVLQDRSVWAVTSMIAIMKLGCIYVPIDNTLPASRIHTMLKDSRTKIILLNSQERPVLEEYPAEVTLVDVRAVTAAISTSNLGLALSGHNSSFIIYTSGSTGIPKGVEQTHQMLFNLIQWDINGGNFRKDTKHLQFSSFSFDSSIHDIYYVLSTGGEVHVINETLRQDLWSLKDYILEREISTLSMPYAALKSLFSEIPAEEFKGHQLNEIISTGEQLYVSGGLRRFLEAHPTIRIHNLYGPSETHVVTGISYSSAEGEIPEKASIGCPIDNTTIYIVDKSQQLVPVGVEGEIYIGGWNLAKGYYQNTEATASKFISNPFRSEEKIYRSGDLGRWLPDGSIEYIGRHDGQVKIRGYRIELEEIERSLRSYPLLEDVVVLAKALTEGGEKELVSYLVSKSSLSIVDVQLHLSRQLPSYMLPSYYIQLSELPLTGNGKVDKRKLPDPKEAGMVSGKEYVAPRNETERRLVKLWSNVLSLSEEILGVKDNFFELGGHSLKATRLVSQIYKEFEVKVELKYIFQYPDIESMANEIGRLIWVQDSQKVEEKDSNIESIYF